MCLFILFLTLFFVAFLSLIIENKDVSAPDFLNSSIWALVAFVAFLNIFYWNYDISLFTLSIVLFSCIFFTLGVRISGLFVKKKYLNIITSNEIRFNERYYKRFLIVFSIIGYSMLFFEICEKSRILNSIEQSFYSTNFLFYLRHKEALGFKGNVSSLLAIAFDVFEGFSFVLISVVARNIMRHDYIFFSRKTGLFLISQIPVLGHEFLSTGRTGFLRYFTVVLVSVLCYLKKYNLNSSIVIKKGFKYIIKTFIFVILIFLFAGIFTGKTKIDLIWNILSVYISSAIVAFDKAVVSSNYQLHSEGILRSLFGVRYIINKIFKISFLEETRADTFIAVSDNLTTNIYTAFYDYYLDFGFIGTLIIYLLFGIVCGFIYHKTKTKKYDFWIAFYAYYAYLMVRQITEAFFLKMSFTEIHIVPIISIILGYFLIIKKIFINKT